jgi:hypothetical protein
MVLRRGFWRDLGFALLAAVILAVVVWVLAGDGTSETLWKFEYRRGPVAAPPGH